MGSGRSGGDQGMTPREELGKLVRDTWIQWAKEQHDPKDSWMVPWEALDGGQREVDMLIGEAVAAGAHADGLFDGAAAEREHILQQAMDEAAKQQYALAAAALTEFANLLQDDAREAAAKAVTP